MTAPQPDAQTRIQALYRQERVSIARHLLSLTGDPTCVEDLVNETFIRAYQALDAFSGRSSLRTWVHGIAINVARNHVAKRRRRSNVQLPPAPVANEATPEDELVRRRALARFHVAIAELEPRLREVFVLRVLEQHGLKEISEMLGIPVSTVHARALRAEQRVRAIIEGESV